MSIVDRIIQDGPFTAGDVQPTWMRQPRAQEFNELRDELIELQAIVAKVENDQCGCLGGPLSIEWAHDFKQAGTCTCGHGMFHEMFHLMPCPIAARRFARRKASMLTEETRPKRRIRACVEAWPGCETGAYDPRCCRFPKSCSATVYDPATTADDELEAE